MKTTILDRSKGGRVQEIETAGTGFGRWISAMPQ